jgi:hypothetical protein
LIAIVVSHLTLPLAEIHIYCDLFALFVFVLNESLVFDWGVRKFDHDRLHQVKTIMIKLRGEVHLCVHFKGVLTTNAFFSILLEGILHNQLFGTLGY